MSAAIVFIREGNRAFILLIYPYCNLFSYLSLLTYCFSSSLISPSSITLSSSSLTLSNSLLISSFSLTTDYYVNLAVFSYCYSLFSWLVSCLSFSFIYSSLALRAPSSSFFACSVSCCSADNSSISLCFISS